jgi:WD40 repeat protein
VELVGHLASNRGWASTDVLSGKEVGQLRLHQAPVRDVAWSPSDALLVSGDMDGFTLEWRPRAFTDKPLTQLPRNARRCSRW